MDKKLFRTLESASDMHHVATMLSKKAIIGTDKSSAENNLSIPNCVDECWVGPGEPHANRLIDEKKAGDRSASQGAHIYGKRTIDRSREGSHP